jgi:hypothetical protein
MIIYPRQPRQLHAGSFIARNEVVNKRNTCVLRAISVCRRQLRCPEFYPIIRQTPHLGHLL